MWIKRTEKEKTKNLKTIDPQMPNYITILTESIAFGHTVIFQNLDEVLDP